ncbi:MAG: 3-keto-5-aminohexanoate cleavage protein, partial [Gammaproteobacteria bacterium]|nr:3-keto-5-aminohexanoate cleavage protein [Gammaproteobacteria bacterium]
FSIGRNEMNYVAAAVLSGSHIRVGLEDNLWLQKGVLATNAQLVEKAATIATNMGSTLMTAAEVRQLIQVKKRAPLQA